MDAVCEECGDAGVKKLLLRCSKCKSAARHRYCLDAIIFDLVVDWSCSGCIPKHNEAIKSLEDGSNQMQLSNSQLGCISNLDNQKVTKAQRPRQKRKYHVDESTEHFLSGDASNLGQCRNKPHEERRDSITAITAQFCSGGATDSCEVFVEDKANRNDCEKEREDINGHLTCAMESSDCSSDLPLDHASEFEPNNLQKAMDGSKLASNSAECTDLSNVSSGCFASSKYVEGLVPTGRKGDIFSQTIVVEGSLPMIGDKPLPTSASMEHVVGLSINREKPEPLKAVEGFEKSVVASKFVPNRLRPIQGSEMKTDSADVLSPVLQHLDSWSMVPMQSSTSNELEDVSVQENSAERMRCLVDKQTNAHNLKLSKPSMDNECLVSNKGVGLSINREKPEPLKAVKGFEKSVVASKFAPNRLKPIQGSELKTDSADVSSPVLQHLDSWSMVPMQSSPSNELDDVAVQENSAERMRCLVDKQTNALNLKLLNPSMESECLVSSEGTSDKANGRSELKTESADVLSPVQQHLGSCSMVPMQSSPSNELEDVAVEKNGARRTRCLVDKQTAPNLKLSKPSMENECLVSNEGNSDKANGRNDVLLSTKGKKMPMRMCGDRETFNSYKKNGISNPAPAKGDRDARNLQRNAGKPPSLVKKVFIKRILQEEGTDSEPAKGDRDARNLQRDAGKPPSIVKKVFIKRILQEEDTDSELLSSKFVGPCEATKINPRKRKQSGSNNPDGTKCQKVARSKRGRPAPAASLRDSQNIPRDAEALQVVDLNSGSCDNDRHVRKKRRQIENAATNQRRCLKRGKEALGSGNLNHRCSKNHKKRSIDGNKDVNASARNLDSGCAESDASQLALQISECIDTQPLDKSYWTGIMEIEDNYVPLAAHLSTKAGKKVQEQSRSLPPILKVTKFSTSKTCPKHLEVSIPSAESIGLYFFSSDTRPNKELDLVKHVADSGIILEAIVGLAKLFLFPSSVLPEEYQMFQGKPYLCGVFKPRKEKIKRLAPVEQDCTARITKEEQQKQHALDQQGEVQGDTLDQVMHPENEPLLDANEVGKETLSGNDLPMVDMRAVVSANMSPADHGRPCSNPEAQPLKLCGVVMSRTPISVELIQEMQKEGALLFPVQQVITEPRSVV